MIRVFSNPDQSSSCSYEWVTKILPLPRPLRRIKEGRRQLAYLEGNAPTREEFDNLEKRVDKLDQKVTPAL